MPRSRRTWGSLKTEIYTLLREEEGTSYWSAPLLLNLFNAQMEMRAAQLMEAHEGWMTDAFTADLVAGQSEYTIPEGTGRIKRVLYVLDNGSGTTEVALVRNERWSGATRSGNAVTGGEHIPSYRMMGELIVLEPAPGVSRTDGLKLEIESLPARIEDDDGKIDWKFPLFTETLLVYDTTLAAFSVEGSQGAIPEGVRDHVIYRRAEMEKAWREMIAVRSHGRVFGSPMSLGD